MKILFTLPIMLIGVLHADEKTLLEPSEFIELRSRWQTARQEAVKPVDEKYQAALEAMKLRFTKAGNLQAAVTVDKEIKSLKSDSEKPASARSVFPEQILSHSWSWTDGRHSADITLYHDKTGVHSHAGVQLQFKWEVSGPRELTLTAVSRYTGDKAILTWNKDYTEYSGQSFGMKTQIKGVPFKEPNK